MGIESALSAFVILFVTIDPVGLLPIFLWLTHNFDEAAKRRTATVAVLISFAVLLFFAVAGEAFLRLLGIGIPALQIAGGLLLFWIAFEMVFGQRNDRKRNEASASAGEDPAHVAVTPLAIPLIAGPGAITASILLAARLDGAAGGVAVLALLQASVLAITFAAFLTASRLAHLLGRTGILVMTRLLGIVLAALAVQTVIGGVAALVTGELPAGIAAGPARGAGAL